MKTIEERAREYTYTVRPELTRELQHKRGIAEAAYIAGYRAAIEECAKLASMFIGKEFKSLLHPKRAHDDCASDIAATIRGSK